MALQRDPIIYSPEAQVECAKALQRLLVPDPIFMWSEGFRVSRDDGRTWTKMAMGPPQEATCACGRTYYADEGSQCPKCAPTLPTPFLLRDQCGCCGMPCSADWCPYCEGCHDSEEEANASRRATEFAVKQQGMLHDQLVARDRVIRGLEAARDIALTDASHYQQRVAALCDRLDAAATEVVRLRDQQARLRTAARRTLVGSLALCAAGGLSWLCWDRLPGWSPDAIERWRILVSFAIGALGTHMWLKRKKLPGGNPGKSPRPAAPEPTGAGPTPRNTSS